MAADAAAFEEVRHKGPLDGHPGWTLAVGYTLDRIPMTPTLLAVREGGEACDLTRGLEAFLGAAAAPRSDDEAVRLALLAAEAVYVDAFPDLVLLPAMGLEAPAPVVTPVEGGRRVEFSAWTERNGLVGRFTVTLDGDVDVGFEVVEQAAGPFRGEMEGWLLRKGDTHRVLTGEGFLDATRVIMGDNVDGTKWRVTYFTERYTSEEEASYHANMHLDAAIAAYTEAHSWGFSSADPDGILDLTLSGCDCIFGSPHADIRMFPRANDILPLLPGLAYRSEAELALLIAGHELFHHFQYGINQWRMGWWMTEGQARFSETVHVPDATFLPTTLVFWPNDNGMNGFVLNPNRQIGAHSYDWAIVWGYLAAHNGGMALIKAVLEESATGGTNPNTDGVAAIDRALARFPDRTHANFREAYEAFTVALYTREGFVWGKEDGTQVHDWATYLVASPRMNAPGSGSLQPWGIQFVDAKPASPAGGAVAALVVQDGNSVARLVGTTPDGFVTEAVAPAGAATGVSDAVVALVRPGVFGGSSTWTTVVART